MTTVRITTVHAVIWTRLFSLPWPPSGLSPNKRQHFMALARAKKAYRKTCWAETLVQRAEDPPADGQIEVEIQFCPPDKRKHDADNLIARAKSGLDGVADALGVNDNRFKLLPMLNGAVTKGGCVWVRLTVKEAP